MKKIIKIIFLFIFASHTVYASNPDEISTPTPKDWLDEASSKQSNFTKLSDSDGSKILDAEIENRLVIESEAPYTIKAEKNHSDHSIILIHIGPEIPSYLFTNIEQIRLFNPNSPIFIVGNKEALARYETTENVSFIYCEELEKTKEHLNFCRLQNFDKSFDNFWILTSERLFYLHETIKKMKLKNVFHLENDVMLYVDLEELLPILKQNYREMIAATFDSDFRAILGIMFISSEEPIQKLTQFMEEKARESKNDMEILPEFKKTYPNAPIKPLPIINPSYVKKYGLRNQLQQIAKNPSSYYTHFSEFQSIFDAAAIGQYLGGISPRNGGGSIGFINETCLFDPSKLTFVWKSDDKNRFVPYVCFENEEFRINNLHIHSKNLEIFKSKGN